MFAGYVLERYIKRGKISNHQGLTPLVNMDSCNWCPLLHCWSKLRNLAIAVMFPTVLRKFQRSCTWPSFHGKLKWDGGV